MVLQPALEGLLGLDVDAGRGLLKLAPALPANWDSLEVRNIRIGRNLVNMQFKRNGNLLSYSFSSECKDKLVLDLAPLLPPGTQVLSCKLNNADMPFSTASTQAGTRVNIEFNPGKFDLLELEARNGISVLPVIQYPKPGYSSEGLRIIDASLNGNVYSLVTENKAESSGLVSIWTNGQGIDHVENGILLTTIGKISTIQVLFPEQETKYIEVPLKIYLK
jgi:hypothetical protein